MGIFSDIETSTDSPFTIFTDVVYSIAMTTIPYEAFESVDIRIGRIVSAEVFPEARKPAYKLKIDFGSEIGIKQSSAQITVHYTPETLVGRLVMAVVNFAPRQIGPFMSEVLVLGFSDANGDIVLARPDADVPLGEKMH